MALKRVNLTVAVEVNRSFRAGLALVELEYNGVKKEGERRDLNKAEGTLILQVTIDALQKLKYPCEVNIVSNNEYLVKGVNFWVKSWAQNGWKTKVGKPVANQALWEKLWKLLSIHTVKARQTNFLPLAREVHKRLEEKIQEQNRSGRGLWRYAH